MKIRQGFVSNSSSSSFILANKTGNTKIMMEVDLNDLFETTVQTIKELDERYVSHHGYGDIDTIEKILDEEDYLKEEYQICVDKIKNGFILFFGRASSDDDGLSAYFYNNGIPKTDTFEVVRDDE